jgi:glycosyltransferase involved in cell wall biosynthesis
MEKTTKIIYIKPAYSSFIRGDEQILDKKFDVKPVLLNQNGSKILFGINLFLLFIRLLSQVFSRNVIFISWFADYHSAIMSFVGKLTGKKTIIFIGGQEAISYPELKKGVYRKKIRGACVKFALRNTDLIIANHKSLIYHENHYYNAQNPHIDGIKHYVPNLKTPTEIIYNGIDSERIKRDLIIPKIPNLILTVGTMSHLGDFKNKGFDLFIEIAARNSDLNFVLIGLNPNYLTWTEENYNVSKIKNLEIIPSFCPQDVLNRKYNEATVFVQASITEGMPNTLSEAMLMECIPVGSNINGIPDAIGDTGIIVKNRNIQELEIAIREALKMKTGLKARERVLQLFSKEKRERELLKLMENFLDTKY